MTTTTTILTNDSAVKRIKNAKKRGRTINQFYQITSGTKNSFSGMSVPVNKELKNWIGNDKVELIVWKT